MTKSAKSKFCDGVFGAPNVPKIPGVPEPPLGVVIIEDGSAMFFGGGVEGGCIRVRAFEGFAGEGELARYRRSPAPSSAVLPAGLTVRLLGSRGREAGGGVRGEPRTSKECAGRASSSSSEWDVKPPEEYISSLGCL